MDKMIRLKKRSWAHSEGAKKYVEDTPTIPKKCYDCNNELKRQLIHKVTLRNKARFFCGRCYEMMVEKMRKEKNDS
jgi:hypothetical protein